VVELDGGSCWGHATAGGRWPAKRIPGEIADDWRGEFRERSPAAANLMLGGGAAGEENSGSDRRPQLIIHSGRAPG
jgi:hypothetical protein